MLEDALRYPWTGEKNIETIAIGGILSLLGVFFVPTLFVYGYLVRVIRRVGAGEEDPPPVFDEWTELLVDGIAAFAISLVYFLVPAVVIALGALAWILPVSVSTAVAGSGANGAASAGGGVIAVLGVLLAVVTFTIGLVTLVAALYLFPAAVGAYARTGSFGAAFSPSTLRKIGTSNGYAVAWLVAIVIGILAQVVAGAVAVTVLGIILIPFITFYGNVGSAYAIGRGVSDIDLLADRSEETVSIETQSE